MIFLLKILVLMNRRIDEDTIHITYLIFIYLFIYFTELIAQCDSQLQSPEKYKKEHSIQPLTCVTIRNKKQNQK